MTPKEPAQAPRRGARSAGAAGAAATTPSTVPLEYPAVPANYSVETLPHIPSLADGYKRAALGVVPGLKPGHRPREAPAVALRVEDLRVDAAHVAAYAGAVGVRLTNELPLTYPFVLSFPLIMSLITRPDFPTAALGSVHIANTIRTARPLTVDDILTLEVFTREVTEHRRGLIATVITTIFVGSEAVWTQESQFLSKQRTSLSDAPGKPQKPAEATYAELGPPTSRLSATPRKTARYAAVSGDRNPIHISRLGAKAFGFPGTIAHGMWSAAALLASVEGGIPQAATYTVSFGPAIVLPTTVGVWVREAAGGAQELELRDLKRLKPHVTARLEAR